MGEPTTVNGRLTNSSSSTAAAKSWDRANSRTARVLRSWMCRDIKDITMWAHLLLMAMKTKCGHSMNQVSLSTANLTGAWMFAVMMAEDVSEPIHVKRRRIRD